MGIGTTLYGQKDFNPQDGFYTATKWGIWFLLPIFPMSSYRARRVSSKSYNYVVAFGTTTSYQLVKIPLDTKQVLMTYLGTYGSIGLFILFLSLFPDYAGYTTLVFGVALVGWIVKLLVDNHRMSKPIKEPLVSEKWNFDFCKFCGKPTIPNSKFCKNCGKQLMA